MAVVESPKPVVETHWRKFTKLQLESVAWVEAMFQAVADRAVDHRVMMTQHPDGSATLWWRELAPTSSGEA